MNKSTFLYGITSTGTIHKAMGQNSARCSHGGRGLSIRILESEPVKGNFCKKCFPNKLGGK